MAEPLELALADLTDEEVAEIFRVDLPTARFMKAVESGEIDGDIEVIDEPDD